MTLLCILFCLEESHCSKSITQEENQYLHLKASLSIRPFLVEQTWVGQLAKKSYMTRKGRLDLRPALQN